MPRHSKSRFLAALTLFALTLLQSFALAADSAGTRYWPPIVDPATGQHTPGRWVWADLVTSDVASAADFYGRVFGWTFETYGGADDYDTYTLALADGLPIGGLVFDRRAAAKDAPSARWLGLFSVTDVEAAAKSAGTGGKLLLAPTELGERGLTAAFEDPEGAVFGLVRSRNGDPDDFSGGLNEWAWVDLWTNDVGQASDYYSRVLDATTQPAITAGTRAGVHLVSGGYARAGIMAKRDARSASVWVPYLRVADANETVRLAVEAGGRLHRGPTDIGGAWVAILVDPTGAAVGIVQFVNQEAQP